MVLVLPKRGATERPRVAFEAAEQEASSGAPTEVVAQTTTVWRFRTVSVSRASNQRRSCSAGQPGCSHPRLPGTRASAPPTDPLKKSAGIEAAVAEAGERLRARWQLEQAARERLREVHWPPRPGAPSGRDALPTAGVRAHQLSEADYGRVGPPRRCDCFPHSVLRDRNARHGRDGEGPRLACDGPEGRATITLHESDSVAIIRDGEAVTTLQVVDALDVDTKLGPASRVLPLQRVPRAR
jgi:hypothetical protein